MQNKFARMIHIGLAGLQFTGGVNFLNQGVPRSPGTSTKAQDMKLALQGNLAPGVTLDAGPNQQHPASGSGAGDDHIKVGVATSPGGKLTVDSLYSYKLALSRQIGDLFSLDLADVVQADDPDLAGMRTGLKKHGSAKVGVTAHW